MESCATVILAGLILALLWMFNIKHKRNWHLPPGPTAFPLIGNLLQIGKKAPFKSFVKFSETYGPVMTVYLGWQRTVVLVGYDAVKEALVDQADDFTGRAPTPFIHNPNKKYGLGSSNGERWRQLRRFTMTTLRDFGMGRKGMDEWIQEESEHMRDYIHKLKGAPFDPTFLLSCTVSNVICCLVFGQRFSYEDKQFLRLLTILSQIEKVNSSPVGQMYNLFPKLMDHLPGPHQKIFAEYEEVRAFIKMKIQEHKDTLDPSSPRDYIDSFLIQINQFALRGVSADNTKYHHVVASLDLLSTRRVMTILRDPPIQGKYTAVKVLLLSYSLSDAECAKKRLSLSGLGDGTALELTESTLSLLGTDDGGFLFTHVFLQQCELASPTLHCWLRRITAWGDVFWLTQAPRIALGTLVSSLHTSMKEKEISTTEFHYDNLVSTIMTLFLAGTQSTSSTLRFALSVLIKYPQIQEKMQQEIDTVIGKGRCPRMEDRKSLPFSLAVIHEVQRFLDHVPLSLPHYTLNDISFRGYTIPKDTVIIPLLHSVLKEEKQWATPRSFNPQHFLDNNGSFKKSPAFMPFSAGKRNCVGESLARMELFIFIVSLLQDFTFSCAGGPDSVNLIPEYSSFINVPCRYHIMATPR